MTNYKDAKYNFSGANLTGIPTSAFTSGTFADARISSGSVTQHVTAFNDKPLRNDVAVMALHSAVGDNKTSYNLPNSFIDQFEDDTGYDGNGPGSAGSISPTHYAGGDLDIDPNDGGEFVSSVYEAPVKRGDTSTTGPDIQGTAARSGTQEKIGTYSLATNGGAGNSILFGSHRDFAIGTGDYTIEAWTYLTNVGVQTTWFSDRQVTQGKVHVNYRGDHGTKKMQIRYTTDGGTTYVNNSPEFDISVNTWTHFALVFSGGINLKFFKDGTAVANASVTYNIPGNGGYFLSAMTGYTGSAIGWYGYIDEMRWSNSARYSSNFTPSTSAFTPDANTMCLLHMEDTGLTDDPRTITNATGTLIGNQQTANASQTKMSGVMLYKDAAGTATVEPDLKIYFTCDGGSNWTESASYGTVTQVFATGIKMVRLGETTCTAGTGCKYKAVWANQSAAKITQLHGIGINY